MMGLLVVIYIVFCEVKRLKFIIPIRGSDTEGGTSCYHHVVTDCWGPPHGYCELCPWSLKLNTCLILWKR